MSTQIAFSIDEKLKKEFMQKAKKDGLTLKAFLSYCMREYTNGALDMRVVSNRVEEDDGGNWETIIDFKKEWITNDEFVSFLKDSIKNG